MVGLCDKLKQLKKISYKEPLQIQRQNRTDSCISSTRRYSGCVLHMLSTQSNLVAKKFLNFSQILIIDTLRMFDVFLRRSWKNKPLCFPLNT